MLRILLTCVLVLLVTTLVSAQAPADLMSEKIAVRLLVPAYIFPSLAPAAPEGLKKWSLLMQSASADCPIVAILNPAGGPVDRNDPKGEPWRLQCYSTLLKEALKNSPHLRFVMYVPLARTKKTAGDRDWAVQKTAVEDIDTWLKTYPPRQFPNLIGFFLDEHPAFDPAQIAAAAVVRTHAAKVLPQGLIFLNLGQTTEQRVLEVNKPREVAILWEKPAAAGLRENFKLPAWADEKKGEALLFSSRRFAGLVYSAPTLEEDAVALMSSNQPPGKRLGWLYITDRVATWTELPTYWDRLVALVKKQNARR